MKKSLNNIFLFVFCVSVVAIVIAQKVSADTFGGPFVRVDLTSDGLTYCENYLDTDTCTPYISDGSITWDLASKTLTLNNYQSVPIGIRSSELKDKDAANVVLVGENIISDISATEGRYGIPNEHNYGSIVSQPALTFSGTGSLDYDSITASRIIIEGGELGSNNALSNNLSGIYHGVEVKEGGKLTTGDISVPVFIIDGGEVYAFDRRGNDEDTIIAGLFIMNDGKLTSEINLISQWLYLQNEGEINISNNSTSGRDSNWAALATPYAIFNGGTSSFYGGDFASVMITGPMSETRDEMQREIDTVNNIFNSNYALPETSFAEFNGGDITINGRDEHMFAPFVILNMFNYSQAVDENAVTLSENVKTESGEQFKPIVVDFGEDVNLGLFDDGEGEISYTVVGEKIVFEHAAKKVHIIPNSEDQDDEQGGEGGDDKKEDKDDGKEEKKDDGKEDEKDDNKEEKKDDDDDDVPVNDDKNKNDKSDKNSNMDSNTEKTDGSDSETYDVPDTGYFGVNHSGISIDPVIIFILALTGIASCSVVHKFIVKKD